MARTFFSMEFVIYDGDIQFLDSARAPILGDHLAAVYSGDVAEVRRFQLFGSFSYL